MLDTSRGGAFLLALVVLAAHALVSGAARAGDRAGDRLAVEDQVAQRQQAAESVQPTRHFRVERPANLTGQDALVIYSRILDDMTAAYALSGDPAVPAYRSWRKYNRVPYRSATHGERYINNYANPVARNYGRFEEAGQMPAGAVLAKDSFAVTARGDVFTGPLFLMEKMPEGFHAGTNDWRYSMIMPDGSVFGVTKGAGAERVDFCHSCHVSAGAKNDLFFVPEDNRVEFLTPLGSGD